MNIKGSAYQTFFYKNLKIVFSYSSNGKIAISTISQGKNQIIRFTDTTHEKVKKKTRNFLKDRKEIYRIIKSRHQRFLIKNNINEPDLIDIVSSKKNRNRETRCHSCKTYLSSHIDYSCGRCNWILCACGACGCIFEK